MTKRTLTLAAKPSDIFDMLHDAGDRKDILARDVGYAVMDALMTGEPGFHSLLNLQLVGIEIKEVQ